MINRAGSGRGVRQRASIIKTAHTDVGGAERPERLGLLRAAHQSAHVCFFGRQRLDYGFAGLARRSGDQDHRGIIMT